MAKNEERKKFVTAAFSFWKAFIWGILILFLSLISVRQLHNLAIIGFPNMDKIAHAGMYFFFCLFLMDGFFKVAAEKTIRNTIVSLFISVGFGTIMEFLQVMLTRNRNGEVLDFLANILGAVLGAALYLFFRNRQRNRQRNRERKSGEKSR